MELVALERCDEEQSSVGAMTKTGIRQDGPNALADLTYRKDFSYNDVVPTFHTERLLHRTYNAPG